MCGRSVGDAPFWRQVVAIPLNARVDHAVGVLLPQQLDDFRRMPRFCRLLPVAVEPPQVGVELARQLRQLREVEIHELFPPLGLLVNLISDSVFRPVGIVRMRPVEQREVQSQPQSLSAHLLRKRREQVATRRRILPGAQFSRLGVPQRHAVVVLGRNDGVLRTALLN